MVCKKISCCSCSAVLGSREHKSPSLFLSLKDKGGLVKPASSVITICCETESCFQRMLATTNGELPKSEGLPDAFASHVLSAVSSKNMFPDLDEHMLDTTVDDNHMCKVVKTISHCYSKVGFSNLGKNLQAWCLKIGSERYLTN